MPDKSYDELQKTIAPKPTQLPADQEPVDQGKAQLPAEPPVDHNPDQRQDFSESDAAPPVETKENLKKGIYDTEDGAEAEVTVEVDEANRRGPILSDHERIDKTRAENLERAQTFAEKQEQAEKDARASRKFAHSIEISVKAVGMVPQASRVIELDKCKPADRGRIVEELIEELKADFGLI